MSKIIEGTNIVPIEQIDKNDFNPKPEIESSPVLLERFEKLKKSIEYYGQVSPLIVRELKKNKYEIIDGEHRFFAMKEMGYKEVEIKNLGKMERSEAAKLCLTTELRFEVDPIDRAKLLKELRELNVSIEGLPFTLEEIEVEIKTLDFSFDDYKNGDLPKDKEPKEITYPECGAVFKH